MFFVFSQNHWNPTLISHRHTGDTKCLVWGRSDKRRRNLLKRRSILCSFLIVCNAPARFRLPQSNSSRWENSRNPLGSRASTRGLLKMIDIRECRWNWFQITLFVGIVYRHYEILFNRLSETLFGTETSRSLFLQSFTVLIGWFGIRYLYFLLEHLFYGKGLTLWLLLLHHYVG